MPDIDRVAIAHAIYYNAWRHRTMMDRTIVVLAKQLGATTEGIGDSVKAVGSLIRELHASKKQRLDVNDSLRYSLILPDDNYMRDFFRFKRRAEDQQGMKEINRRNAWLPTDKAEGGYKGVNSVFVKDGVFNYSGEALLQIEVQFHTSDSFKAVKAMHHVYEQKRVLSEGNVMYAALDEICRSYFVNVRPIEMGHLRSGAIPNFSRTDSPVENRLARGWPASPSLPPDGSLPKLPGRRQWRKPPNRPLPPNPDR